MNAQERMAGHVLQLNKFLNSGEVEKSPIPNGEWEARYKRLKAIRDWWGIPWNEIEREVKKTPFPEEWIWESRKDAAFKKYYGFRLQIDKMGVLLK